MTCFPIARRDVADRAWTNTSHPYRFGGSTGLETGYCDEWNYSLEWLIAGAQTYFQSYEHPTPWREMFIALSLFPINVGCVFATLTYGVGGNYLDWRIHNDFTGNEQAFLAGTASMQLAYTPRAGRNDDAGDRQKYGIMHREPVYNDDYGNEGYFAVARSEITYQYPFNFQNNVWSFLQGVPGIGWLLNDRLGNNRYPDMWSPRWKSRMRPMVLPGEAFASPISENGGSFYRAVMDTMPYLSMAAVVGLGGPYNDPRLHRSVC